MTESTSNQPLLAADGSTLKQSLNRALRLQKIRALALIGPLLIFVLITFISPIVDMLFRSVENEIVSETLPRTTDVLENWDATSGEIPEEAFEAMYTDLWLATEYKIHTRLGSRLNYQQTGVSSLFRKTGRRVDRFDTDIYTDQFNQLNTEWADPATWDRLFASGAAPAQLYKTQDAYQAWKTWLVNEEEENPLEEDIPDFVYTALYSELRDSQNSNISNPLIAEARQAVSTFDSISLRQEFIDADEDWGSIDVWKTIKLYSPEFTSGYLLNAVDMKKTLTGVEMQPENEQIYLLLFERTLKMSLTITLSCILLGYPVAFLLANLPARKANLLMILVLLPFWTSLLVRTSAWKVLLQQQGVINDLLVWIGLVDDASRLIMMNNQTGTIIAMTHILLPFMILPLYSVMKTIPPSYVRAARSLGATSWTGFRRVYFPQSIAGIGAGSILVFIMAIGYYITPELVGGTDGIFISNRIAYHISSSLNWGLGAALGAILLLAVLVLYWCYDKFIGIDNMKLG